MKLSIPKLKKVINRCFVGDIQSVTPISSGNINNVFDVKLKGSSKSLILRLYNEPWKVEKEVFVYRDIRAHIDVPVPEVYCYDDSLKEIPYGYILMSKLEGKQIDKVYKKTKSTALFSKAGEALAKIHKIKFPKYGWLVGNEIRPSFNSWHDFAWHDIELKLERLKKYTASYKVTIERYLNNHAYLLNVTDQPCLLHKDYHCPHIFFDKNKLTGILDVEWAIAGHNENDFMKLEHWTFPKLPKQVRNAFFKGYLKYGMISSDYADRKKLYDLWHQINMLNISFEIKNKSWLDVNLKSLKNFFK